MLKFALIRNFSSNTKNELVLELFGRTMAMKINGYVNKYQDGILLCNTIDFISDHLILYIEDDGKNKPIMSYRVSCLNDCEKYQLNLPVFDLYNQNMFPEHDIAHRDLLKSAKKEGKWVFYNSSLTYDFHLVKKLNLDVASEIKAMHTFYQHYYIPENFLAIGAGTVKFKMHRYYEFWGYNYLSLDNKKLSPVSAKHVKDDLTQLYYSYSNSEESVVFMKNHIKNWDEVVIFDGDKFKKTA